MRRTIGRCWLLFLLLVVATTTTTRTALAEEVQGEDDSQPKKSTPLSSDEKRLGRNKKKVNDQVFASYGLSPHAGKPGKTVEYSRAAVKAASTGSGTKVKARKTASSGKRTRTADGAEPSAPGTQAKVDLRPYMSPVEDQRNSNSCAANAVAGSYEYLATRAAIRDGEDSSYVGDISRLFIYYVGRKRDQVMWGENTKQKPKDEGMTLQAAIEAVQLKGAALQSSWPYDLQNVNARPPEEAFQEAMNFKVGDAMNIPLDLDKMRQCLSDGYPIIFGLKLTAQFFAPPYDGFIPTPDPNDPQSAEHGLHAMLIVGYNDRQRIFIVRNSWGTDWGVDGYAYLSYDYVANEEFNFVGMYAIQSLTDDDLTPDDDDGHDLDQLVDPSNMTPHYNLLEDVFEDGMIDEDEEMDADDMFSSLAEARRAFMLLAGTLDDMGSENLQLSRDELKKALLLVGIPMVTEAEIDMAMRYYDDDKSGYITLDEFLDMQDFFDGSLLRRTRFWHKVKKGFGKWMNKLTGKPSSNVSDGTGTSTSEETASEL